MRAIDADALKDRLQTISYDDWNQGVSTTWANAYAEFADMVEDMPTIEPERKGKWIYHPEIKNVYGGKCIECSECGEKYMVVYIEDEKYCRNCGSFNGAKMEVEDNGKQ